MKVNYFSKNRKRKKILDKLKEKRLIYNGFQYPLGIMIELDHINIVTEGCKIEYNNTQLGDMYFYTVSISMEKLSSLLLRVLKIFPSYITLIIERSSEDINREYDILFSDPDISIKEAKAIFKRYEELWTECSFVGFGVLDELSGFEIFINPHKEIEMTVPRKYSDTIDKILDRFSLLDNDNVKFLSEMDHWHYSLSYLTSNETGIEKCNYAFDYYYITNSMKNRYGFKIINLHDDDIKVAPRWWCTTVKGLGRCKRKMFITSYYIVAETFEEMETLVDIEMSKHKVDYYYIHDYFNIDPESELNSFNIRKKNKGFKDASFGIWAESDIFISDTKSIVPYMINKPYATTYQNSI